MAGSGSAPRPAVVRLSGSCDARTTSRSQFTSISSLSPTEVVPTSVSLMSASPSRSVSIASLSCDGSGAGFNLPGVYVTRPVRIDRESFTDRSGADFSQPDVRVTKPARVDRESVSDGGRAGFSLSARHSCRAFLYRTISDSRHHASNRVCRDVRQCRHNSQEAS